MAVDLPILRHANDDSMSRPVNVLIYGGGAVGSIFGWRLAQQANVRVSVVCRSNYDTVKRYGFTFDTRVWGAGHLSPHRVYKASELSRVPAEPFDYVVCANKVSHDSCPSIIRDLKNVVNVHTTFVSAQNGMDVELPLKQAFPNNTVLSAICNIGCSQVTPGHIEQRAGMNPKAFLLGVYGSSPSPTAVMHRDQLAACDARFGSVEKVCEHRWKKLLFNSVWNATSALTNLNTHEALAHPDALHLARSISREAYRVAIKAGVSFDSNYAEEVIDLARRAEAITPSTLQDARNERAMEIDSIWGYLVEKAAQCRVSVPTIALVHDLLRHMNTAFAQRHDMTVKQQLADIAWSQPTPRAEVWFDMHNEELGRYRTAVA